MSERFKMFWCAPDMEQAEILEGNFLREDLKERIQREMKQTIQNKINFGEDRIRDPEIQQEVKKINNKASKLL